MSTSFDSLSPFWEMQEHQNRLERRITSKTFYNWLLIIVVFILGIWVLVLTYSSEPGVQLQIFNESGQKLKDVKLMFSWSEYSMPELPAAPLDSRYRPYGALIQKVVRMDANASILTIAWTDAKGVKYQHVEKDMYLVSQSVLIKVTFRADGTVSVTYKSLSFG